jgi:hypothetical protein
MLSIENNVRPNRTDSDHVLIMKRDVDFWSEWKIRWRRTEGPDITSYEIRSVQSRSRRIMIILNKLFIHQFESNYDCRLYVGQRSLTAKITSNWACIHSEHSAMLLLEVLGT